MDSFKDINLAFKKKYKDKTILRVVDYPEENIYVIQAVPTKRLKEAGQWLDGMYSMDRASLAIIGGFNPLMHNPDLFFNLPADRTYRPTADEVKE